MIKLTQLSDQFEKGLNAVLNNSEIKFKIWSEAGQYTGSRREGNTVTYFINGNLRTATSANDANDLVMGVNGLSLEFAIPVQQPRTNTTQTAEQLAKIRDAQYPFITLITNAINGYFQKAWSITLPDDSGVEFSVSWQAGTAVSGDVDILPHIGEGMTVSVFIEVYFIQGGVNSKNIKLTIDGDNVPYKAIRYGRAPMIERDVYASRLVSKSLISSTAFSIDIDFPITSAPASMANIDYLFNGEPNTAHFVNVQFGALEEKLYLMTLNTIQVSAEGIAVAGASASLIEVVENIAAVNVPDGFQVGKFVLNSSAATTLSFTPSADCKAFIAGNAYALNSGEQTTIDITSANIEPDENNKYCVYIITDAAVNFTGSASFGVVKGGTNG